MGLKKTSILNLAEKNGYKVEYKKYGYWDNILHINGTAIAFNVQIDTNGSTLLTCTESFPAFCTLDYIKSAIEYKASSLGYKQSYQTGTKPFGGKIWDDYSFTKQIDYMR